MNFNTENIRKMVSSDEFLELPKTTQPLFFHLIFDCDSNGVSNRPKTIAKGIGVNISDLELLENAYFIRIDNGNCIIGMV